MPIPSQSANLDRKSAKTIVYNTLKEWIIDGTLRPGEKIVDSEISEYFSVSRTPVREALQLLSEINLVDIVPSKATRVSLLDETALHHVYEALAFIHSAAVELSFDAIDGQTMATLQGYNQGIQTAFDAHNHKDILQLDHAFHNTFLQLAHNPYLISYNQQLLVHVSRVENLNFNLMHSTFKSMEEHNAILQAIAKGDKQGAVQAMRENWLRFIEIDVDAYNPPNNK